MRFGRLRIVVSPAICIALLVACGGGSSAGSASFGGSVTIGLSQVGTLDPPRATGLPALSILRTACDGIVGLEAGSRTPRPALAESWSLSSVARLLRVRLHDDLQFQDGTEVTSAAVREALSRVVRPGTGSPWSGLLAKVEGYEEVASGAATSLSGVRIIDDTNFEIRLSVPGSEFPTVLSHPALTPVSLESVRQNPEGAEMPVCAGPYRVQPGAGEQDFRLGKVPEYTSRNEAYLEGGAGQAELILIRTYDSPEDAYQAYRAGEVDIAPVPDSRLAEAQAGDNGFHGGATPEVTYLGFAPSQGPSGDPRVRQAISLAINRIAIIEAVFGDGRAPALRWLQDGGTAQPAPQCSEVARRIADPGRAGQLLAEAEVDPEAVELPFHYSEQGRDRLVAEGIMVQVDEALGIDLVPTPVRGRDVEDAYSSAEPSAWLLSTRVELPLPDQFLAGPFRTGGSLNVLGFSDPAFDDRIHAAERASSPEEASRLYAEAESRLCEQMPAIPLWRAVRHWIVDEGTVEFEGDRVLGPLGFPLLRHARAVG